MIILGQLMKTFVVHVPAKFHKDCLSRACRSTSANLKNVVSRKTRLKLNRRLCANKMKSFILTPNLLCQEHRGYLPLLQKVRLELSVPVFGPILLLLMMRKCSVSFFYAHHVPFVAIILLQIQL